MPFRKSNPWGKTKPPVGSQVDWGDPINSQLFLCYLLGEGAGLLTRDIANNSVGVGAEGNFSPGTFGSAWVQPTSGSPCITGPSNVQLQLPTRAVTLAAHIIIGKQGAEQGILKLSENSGGYNMLYLDGNSPPKVGFVITTGGSPTNVVSTGGYAIGGVLMVVGVYNGSNMTLYVNGVSNASAAKTGSITYNTQPIRIGSEEGRYYFGGIINYAYSWRRALTASEVAKLYSAPFAGILASRRRIISGTAAAGGFKGYWVPRKQRSIGLGVI